jgi:hypothetical protein
MNGRARTVARRGIQGNKYTGGGGIQGKGSRI